VQNSISKITTAKRVRNMGQVIKHLASKYKALSSNSNALYR
jgi:hypothetical protein